MRYKNFVKVSLIFVFLTGCLTPQSPTLTPAPYSTATITPPQAPTATVATVLLEETKPTISTPIPAFTPTSQPEPASPSPTVIPPTAEFTATLSPTETPTKFPTPTPLPEPLPVAVPKIGTETHSMAPLYVQLLNEANIRYIRRNAYLWSYVEGDEGNRIWGNMGGLEEDLITASENGINIILIIRSTPYWAQKVRGSLCGPVKREKLDSFASFMHDLVARLSQPPYNVKYWELGNEPDVDPSQVPPENVFGCWADKDDPYFGGRFYGEMLSHVYPAIKSADPDAQVLIGGLLLDCDPEHPPEGKDCTPAYYFKGILENGGGDFFDIVSYHGYPLYNGSVSQAEATVNWKERGGVVVGKYLYLKEIMQSYGVDKPVWLTEGSLICHERNLNYCSPPGDDFYEAQAAYAVMLFVRNWAIGIRGTLWFDFEAGWRHGAMLDRYHHPKPVYRSTQFLIQELSQAYYIRPVERYPELTGYEFTAPGKQIWVLWSSDDNEYTILLPDGVTRVFDKYGIEMVPLDGMINVSQPVYVELTP